MNIPEGIINAQIMPCNEDGVIDFAAMGKLIARQRDAGIKGLFVLGTAGMGPLMTIDERLNALTEIVARAGGLAVIVHTGASRLEEVETLTRHAVGLGVAAVASVPPVYYQPDFAVVASYYRKLKSFAGSTPVIAYNNPNATGVHLTPDQLGQLTEEGVIEGVKQSWSSVAELHALLRKGVRVWVANANLATAGFAMGAYGAVSTITNVTPELFVDLFEAMRAGRLEEARALQHRIDIVASKLRDPIIGALHAGCEALGYSAGMVRSPLRMPTAVELTAMTETLRQSYR